MDAAEELFQMAQTLANVWPDFFVKKGPGAGDRATAAFMKELRGQAKTRFGCDHAEQQICGATKLAVDFYFPQDGTIVEIAMSLRNPLSEFERDILKAIIAQEAGNPVRQLLFFSKPGARARCEQPGLKAFADWALHAHGIRILVREFSSASELILDAPDERDS